MSSRKPRRSEDLPVFRTGMNSSVRDSRESGAVAGKHTLCRERSKRLQRKPPVPTAAAAAAAPLAQGTPHAASGSYTRGRDARDDQYSPRKDVKGVGSPRKRDKPVQRVQGRQPRPHVRDGGIGGSGRGGSRELDRKHLLRMLRQAVEEMDILRRDLVYAHRERSVWKERDEVLSRTVARLEGRCEALEGRVGAESDAALAEAGRAKAAEERFARLLAWAREEERRRLLAEESLKRASDAGHAAEERRKELEEEARESKRQLDERRFKLEGALEDLRCRTSENERLEAQAATTRGQVEALRALADARGVEVKELREKLERLVKEAKCMSSENVKLRKRMTSEQEQWRAAERSRAKQDDRRRMEMEQKSDDLHALRHRTQELEARLLSETTRRQGAEEDARLSQEMERRSMEELLASRKATMTTRSRAELAQSYPPHLLHPAPATGTTGSAWKPWDVRMVQDGVTTVGMTSGARSSNMSDAFRSDERIRNDGTNNFFCPPAGSRGLPDPPARPRRADQTAAGAASRDPTPSPSSAPTSRRMPPSLDPPAYSASTLLASLRGRGEQRPPFLSGAGTAASGVAPSYPQLRPNARDPVREEDGFRQELRCRPQPRQAPSEDHRGRRGDDRNTAGGDALSTGCSRIGLHEVDNEGRAEESARREWWAGSPVSESLGSQPASENEGYLNREDEPLRVVSL